MSRHQLIESLNEQGKLCKQCANAMAHALSGNLATLVCGHDIREADEDLGIVRKLCTDLAHIAEIRMNRRELEQWLATERAEG